MDTPVNVETPNKNINITSSKTLTNLDKSKPNCHIIAETPALKDNSGSKATSNISENIQKSSDSSTLPEIPEPNELVHEVPPATDQRSVFRCNDYFRNEMFDTFYGDYLQFKYYMLYINGIIKSITLSSELATNLSNDNVSSTNKNQIACRRNCMSQK